MKYVDHGTQAVEIGDTVQLEPNDYRISWKYIVDKMAEKNGLDPTSELRLPMGNFDVMLRDIWYDYIDELDKSYEMTKLYDPNKENNNG